VTPDVCHEPMPIFDKKYKTILRCSVDESYIEKINWLNSRSSGSVDIKILSNRPPPLMVIGFEDESDALIFKIRYL